MIIRMFEMISSTRDFSHPRKSVALSTIILVSRHPCFSIIFLEYFFSYLYFLLYFFNIFSSKMCGFRNFDVIIFPYMNYYGFVSCFNICSFYMFRVLILMFLIPLVRFRPIVLFPEFSQLGEW